MNPRTKYRVGTAILFLAIAVLIVEILGMTGSMPKYGGMARELNVTAIVLLMIAAVMRRQARAQMSSTAPRDT